MTVTMANEAIVAAIKAALAAVEIPGGGDLAGYGGLSRNHRHAERGGARHLGAPGMEAAFGPARVAAQEAAAKVAEGRKVMVSVTSDRAQAGDGPGQGAGPAGPAAADARSRASGTSSRSARARAAWASPRSR